MIEPSPEIIYQAQKNPNGWVYEIDGDVTDDQHVPPDKIRGAWKVGPDGRVTGEYTPNMKHPFWTRSHIGGSQIS